MKKISMFLLAALLAVSFTFENAKVQKGQNPNVEKVKVEAVQTAQDGTNVNSAGTVEAKACNGTANENSSIAVNQAKTGTVINLQNNAAMMLKKNLTSTSQNLNRNESALNVDDVGLAFKMNTNLGTFSPVIQKKLNNNYIS
jgi:hypothetical protein